MSTVIIKVCNARREPLADRMDVHVVSSRSDETVRRVLDVPGTSDIRVEGLLDHQPYVIKVFPARHRPVGQFVIPQPGRDVTVQVYTPIDPEHVKEVKFPPYDTLSKDLQRVLDCSACEGVSGSGPALYKGLSDTERAGLFNLFAKMSSFGFDDEHSVWTFVDSVYRIRPDRIFVNVQPALRDRVKGAVVGERFRAVSGRLHTPPPGFVEAGSFKTADRYGNLQLSFFSADGPPLQFKVDADIDDVAGLGHVFQVLRNWVTDGTTHPYDVHEILTFRQEVTLPYDLA